MKYLRNLIWLLFIGPAFIAEGAITSNYTATVFVDFAHRLGEISPYIYGQYLEHVQRVDECIYPSIWDDKSKFSDEMGLRRDVIAVARELGVPVVRWPGGCFADVYHWRDGIGSREQKPLLKNKHWGGEEPNHFGTDEFLRFCKLIGSEAYLTANLGTGTLDECLTWLNYCNATDQRVQFWGIGNETFAKWEAGQMDAKTYSRVLAEWAGAVRKKDPRVKIMAVGSMSGDDSDWDRAVLEKSGNLIDYLTIHNYGIFTGNAEDCEAVAFTPVYFEQRFRKMLAVVEEFSAKRTNAQPIHLALDEWNIRHYQNEKLIGGSTHSAGRGVRRRNFEQHDSAKPTPLRWRIAFFS